MPASTYYYHFKRRFKEDKDKPLEELIHEIVLENKGRYGYRRVTATLKSQGHIVNHKRVRRIMNRCGLTCKVRMKKYQSFNGGKAGKIAPNLLNRKFHTDKPNEKWVTDVTEFHLFGQKIYLSPILDLCSGDIVCYNISRRPDLLLVTDMVKMALKKLPKKHDILLHSDQGWQYMHKEYQELLKRAGITQSMSRRGNCHDNAVMENFFGLLKTELLYLREFNSVEQFISELESYLDYYNNKRIKVRLGYMSPIEHRSKLLEN